MSAVAPTLEAFFTQRLISHKRASPHTIAAYRDGFRLLLAFAQDRCGKAPSQLDFGDLDAPAIGAFLAHLERGRGNSAQSRNARLAAIHSLFRFAALAHPEHAQKHRPGTGHPTQTLRPGADHLPHRTRGRRAAHRLRPVHLDRPARPRAAAARRPDRPADLRTDRTHPR